jgi:acetoin utilization deacetylase AcuC-like enzyme
VFYDARMVADAQSYSPSAGKPREVVESWKQLGIALAFPRFEPASREQLCLAHAPAFVDGILAGQISNGFGNRSMAVANALPWTSGAMLAAARAAIANGRAAVAPVSGFHHARHGSAGGFCTFNGLIVAVARAAGRGRGAPRRHPGFRPALRRRHRPDPAPPRACRTSRTTPPAPTTELAAAGRAEFLAAIPSRVRQFADCHVLLYQAGADPHIHDPLGGWLTDAQLAQRDRLVFETCRDLGLPVAWNLAGGYQSPLRKVLNIHDATLRACAAVYLKPAKPDLASESIQQVESGSFVPPCLPLEELRRRYDALGPLEEWPGERTIISHCISFEHLLANGYVTAYLMRRQLHSATEAEVFWAHPALSKLVMEAWPE